MMLNVLHQPSVHGCNIEEESLNGRIIGNASSTARVWFHPVNKYIQLTVQRWTEFIYFIRLAILVFLLQKKSISWKIKDKKKKGHTSTVFIPLLLGDKGAAAVTGALG